MTEAIDQYEVASSETHAELREMGSRFIAYAYPVTDESGVKQYLQYQKKTHYSATHHCWAFIIGSNKETQKFSDDREPSNSAGRPILRAIISSGLTNVAVIVVRYFGGKQLGIPGLIKAYEEAAIDALNLVQRKVVTRMESYIIRSPDQQFFEAYTIGRRAGLRLRQELIDGELCLIFDVNQSRVKEVLHVFRDCHTLKIERYATNH